MAEAPKKEPDIDTVELFKDLKTEKFDELAKNESNILE